MYTHTWTDGMNSRSSLLELAQGNGTYRILIEGNKKTYWQNSEFISLSYSLTKS